MTKKTGNMTTADSWFGDVYKGEFIVMNAEEEAEMRDIFSDFDFLRANKRYEDGWLISIRSAKLRDRLESKGYLTVRRRGYRVEIELA